MAAEWASKDITVNAIEPTYFASDASSYTTGQLLLIDGGWTTI